MAETSTLVPALPDGPPAFLDGGGEMGERIRQFDWCTTPLGSPHKWPVSLRTALRILLTSRHPVFIFWGPDHLCFYNDAYIRSMGPEQHPGILGQPAREAWSEIWSIIEPQIDFVMRGEGATWHENHLVPITRHGRQEPVYWTYSYGPIHDEDAPSRVGGVLVLATETTAQVQAVAREREDAQRWRAIFEQSPAFMCMLRGPEHRFEYANPRYLDVIGRKDLALGSRVADVLPEVVGQGFIELLDDVYRTGEPHFAHSARVLLNGVERFVDFAYQPISDETGAVTGILVQGSDVTVREQSRSKLGRYAERLQLATDAANIGIHEYDIITGRLVWDERVRAIWGIGPDEDVTYDDFMAGVLPDDRDATQVAVDRSLVPGGSGVYRAEYRVRDRDGTVRWVRATGRVEFADEIPVRMVGTVQDITREKFDEAALVEADRQKDVFLATLAHELRNPLAPIRSAAELLAMPGISAEQLRWVHDVIARQSRHMSTLLDDLLDVARLKRGRMTLSCETLDLRTTIDTALETVQPAMQQKRHRIAVSVPEQRLIVSGDAIRLCQVFANLLGNAIKYMQPGGNIEISAHELSGFAVVEVRDEGEGLSADALADVFGMFRQVSPSSVRSEGGLGIGLALVRAIVNLHGGRVHARSDGLGQGSTFVVELPLLHAPTPLSESAGGATRRSGATRRVLIADDNADAAQSLALLLSSHGHLVTTARDGIEALEVARTFHPDVLLLDIGMPRLNGYDVARAVHNDMDASARPRLVALTGWGQPDDRQRSLEAGFDAHLTKPPDMPTLLHELGLS